MDNSQDQIQGADADRAKFAEHAEKSAMAQIERLRAAEKNHAQSIARAPDQAADMHKVQIRSAALQAALTTLGASGMPDIVVSAAIQYADFLSGVRVSANTLDDMTSDELTKLHERLTAETLAIEAEIVKRSGIPQHQPV